MVREITSLKKTNISAKIQYKDGNFVLGREEKIRVWKDYITELFDDPSRSKEPPTYNVKNFLPVTVEEVRRTIGRPQRRKIPRT